MDINICSTCKYYRQHYVKHGKNHYIPVDEGHCAHPRLEFRKPESPPVTDFLCEKMIHSLPVSAHTS